jgi:hypothetical protein
MVFEKRNVAFAFGKRIGYLIAYAVFTSALYFVFTFTKKAMFLPYVAAITAFVAILGLIVKRLLK